MKHPDALYCFGDKASVQTIEKIRKPMHRLKWYYCSPFGLIQKLRLKKVLAVVHLYGNHFSARKSQILYCRKMLQYVRCFLDVLPAFVGLQHVQLLGIINLLSKSAHMHILIGFFYSIACFDINNRSNNYLDPICGLLILSRSFLRGDKNNLINDWESRMR